MNRRNILKSLGLAIVTVPGTLSAEMIKPWEYIQRRRELADTDGTPLQFEPKGVPDPNPTAGDIAKYPICPYCGMSRKLWSHSRHLVHYSDDLADGTCSIHCAAISLSLNLDRVPKAIYVADSGAADEPQPLVAVESATYLIGSSLKGTMTANSKKAFASKEAATKAMESYGGTLGSFDEALTAAYLDMAKDTIMIRKRREERRRKAEASKG